MHSSNQEIADKEAKFDLNELFFSITDHESRIVSGNDVFVRISEYPRNELIGSFHNIVRHPDMPKIIFKTLWDYLKAGRPIAAYVKNRTKSGSYYWVLAAVFPTEDRYISIRIKPSSAIFASVRALYFKLLMAESKEGMEESGRILPSLLKELGYENYDHFMGEALLGELKGCEHAAQQCIAENQAESHPSGSDANLTQISREIETLIGCYDRWFERVGLFIGMKKVFEERGEALRFHARDIVFLSLNASVASYRVEEGGETFGILARDVRINAKENDRLISDIYRALHRLSAVLNEMVFTVAAVHLQLIMTGYFVDELKCRNSAVSLVEAAENMEVLSELIVLSSDRLSSLHYEIETQIRQSLKHLDLLEQQVMYLGYIQIYGIIEAAAKNESAGFGGIFSQLKILISQTTGEIEVMQKTGENFVRESRSLASETVGISETLERLQTSIQNLKKGL